MNGSGMFALLSLSSLLIWPAGLTIMYFLRKRFPPSNKKSAAFRALAYVLIFWAGRTLGTLAANAAGTPDRTGAGTPSSSLSWVIFSLPIAILWIIIAYRRIERASWKDLGWSLSHLKRELLFGVLIGIVLVVFRRPDEIFAHRPILHIPLADAFVIFLASFGIASWQEENIYRGYLQPKLEALSGRGTAIIVQAVLFSLAHMGYYGFDASPQFFLGLGELAAVGILLGLYRYRFNSLVAPFIAHGLLDFLPIFWRS